MLTFRQSTASQEIPLGPFVDAADGFTAETGLTIANTDIKIWKNGAAAAVNKNSGGATHDTGGTYIATLDATDTNTVGPMVITVGSISSTNRPIRVECQVLSAAQFDYHFGTPAPAFDANGYVRSHVKAVAEVGDAGSTDTAIRLNRFAQGILTGVVGSGSASSIVVLLSPTEAGNETNALRGKLLTFTLDSGINPALRGQTVRVTASTASGTPTLTLDPPLTSAPGAGDTFILHDGVVGAAQTGDAFARLGAPAGASVSADVAAVKAVLPSALTGGGNIKADALAIDGSTSAADRLEQSARTIVFGTATPASTGTSIVTSGLDPAATVTDQFKGRVLIFRSDTGTAALRGQATRITASTAGGVLTVDQLTTVPNNDSFVIV